MDDTDPCQVNGCDFGGLVDHDGNPMCLVCGRVDYTPREDDDDFDDGMPNDKSEVSE
jgi:hypothetical protein